MSYNRFIRWTGAYPSDSQVRGAIDRFFDGGAERVHKDGSTVFVVLFGVNRLRKDALAGDDSDGERWIEVYHKDGQLTDVITRLGDDYTNALADGLASFLCRTLSGERGFE